ncbi:MAG: histidine kinase [Burkholderiaceae bacterium]
MMRIDWLNKLRYFLQTMAFCLTISAIQFAFQPERPYELPLVYACCIGGSTWALIDFGRHLFPSSAETGWPKGVPGLALPTLGIMGGFVLGTFVADWWFGWSTYANMNRSNLPTSLLVSALAGITGTYYFYTRSKNAYLKARMSEARSHASEAKLKLLETQLEPHMLFNTLANLRVLVATDATRAQTMLDHLIAYLRATLSASRASTHRLDSEFDRLRDYLELMAVRMGGRLAYQLDLPPDLAGAMVPTLLLQPIVENAIKHGLEPKIEGGHILVRASRSEAGLLLEVMDTGVGVQPGNQPHEGFGLQQVRERLAAAYDGRATLELLAGQPAGTRLRLLLPLET